MAKRIDPKADRKQKLEQLKREQRAKERRKTLVTVGIASLLGLGLIGSVTVPAVIRNNKVNNEKKAAARDAKLPLADFGVKAAAAECAEEKVESPMPKGGEHVQEGQTVEYEVIPPNAGQHYSSTVPVVTGFYDRAAKPAPERAVHDLEHGVVVAWYDKALPDAEVKELRRAAASAVDKKMRFVAIPWDRADFSDNKHFVLTSWGRTQRCGKISGEAIDAFVKKNMNSKDAPEAGAQV